MRIWNSSASKKPVRDIQDRCSWCGNRVEWRETFEATRVPLIPVEFPRNAVPPRYRWHLDNGIACLGANPRDYGYCRIKHSTVCPAVPHDDLDPAMESIVRKLAVRIRQMIESGAFVPAPAKPRSEAEVQEPDPATAAAPGGVRHVIERGGLLRIGPGPLDTLRCVAEGPDGQRCANLVLDTDEGRWTQTEIPYAQGRAHQQILNAAGGLMWVWTLTHPDFMNARRWLRQRCHGHSDERTPEAVEVELVGFDAWRHGDFIIDRAPDGYASTHAEPVQVFELSTPVRRICVTDGCGNGTVSAVAKGWKCYKCTRQEKRRQTTHQRWQGGAGSNDQPDQ
ncbi:DUF6083 domain-containing protein [Streptomyces antimycoticus]|uniref:DUF6083 domain-containing protein n=1 Tax=Streptomyces antimycoticus TaxID=68175 RepID=UPI000A3B37E1|nr:DUF6083 domain-containing protein [Streptomyces antimycoticus]